MPRIVLIFLTAFFFALGIAGPAAAGDYAERAIIGFSPDGAYFAFEEFGVQAGSGFPYSNIYVVETATDSWVTGTPIRVRIDEEAVSLATTRTTAYEEAGPALQAHRIGSAGAIVASNPTTETSANPHFISFQPSRAGLPSRDEYSLILEEVILPVARCPDFSGPIKGFRLDMSGPRGTRRLANDKRIPKSRRCPVGYGISDVITFFPIRGEPAVAIIIINIFAVGFEGPDRRFMAIATPL
jgi:predicted secreted protein